MSTFWEFLTLGAGHITDWKGSDHILFLLALCAVYSMIDWKKIIILVTAFTIGHSLTLALAAMQLIPSNAPLIEFLIPLTIFITACLNVFGQTESTHRQWIRYSIAGLFGLIHGLGFSNFLISLLGKEEDILMPLLAFNIGLEIGQLSIVGLILAASYLVLNRLKQSLREWNLLLSGAAMGVSLTMMAERWPF
jgi:HupE / UreJ protein